jgi:hypothetical protein
MITYAALAGHSQLHKRGLHVLHFVAFSSTHGQLGCHLIGSLAMAQSMSTVPMDLQ